MKKLKIFSVLLPFLLLGSACGQTQAEPPESVFFVNSSSVLSVPAASSGLQSDGCSQWTSSSIPPSSQFSSSAGKVSSAANLSSLTPAAPKPPASSLAASHPPAMPPVTAKMPAAPGSAVFAEQGGVLDYSNASQGYIMAKYSGTSSVKVLVYFNGGTAYYQYSLTSDGCYTVIPLQSGSGTYRVRFMENISGNSYAELCSTQVCAACSAGFALYPNQYVNYNRSSAAVAKAKSLCANASSNAEKVSILYQYLCSNIKYDYSKASSIKSGYLPNIDSTLSSKKGICFDYSALMAAMCRAQGIPTKLVIGNTSAGYHAWNEVYLGTWKRYDTTFAAAGQTAGTYTAERYY